MGCGVVGRPPGCGGVSQFRQRGDLRGGEGGPVLPGDRASLLPAPDGVDRHGEPGAVDNRLGPGGLDDVFVRPHSQMMHDASQVSKRQMHYGRRYAAPMETPADRLKAARQKAGYETAKSAAEAMGATVSTYIQHESGVRGYPAKTAARYAKFFRVAPEWLLYGRGPAEPIVAEPTLQALPLVGQVRAGAWLAIDESAQDDPVMLTAALDGRYPHARQWLREVVGDSMNAKGIQSGDLVHLADWAETGGELKTGQVIEVTRYRDGGELREVTLKEVEVNPAGGFLLWPRSTNPKWKEPFVLNGEDDSGVEVRVTGLLLAAIRRF